jgi:hypothetical protein
MFENLSMLLIACVVMIALATLLSLINQVAGTPYIPGGDTPAGTDCSGLASWVANAASDRPMFGSRFNTGNEEAALLQRGFQYGTAPDAVVIGWNGGHTAVTLPDGTSVSSGERGGVRIGGPGAYQRGFTHHMFLPMALDDGSSPPPAFGAPPAPDGPPPPDAAQPAPTLVDAVAPAPPVAPAPEPAPAPEAPAPLPPDAPPAV